MMPSWIDKTLGEKFPTQPTENGPFSNSMCKLLKVSDHSQPIKAVMWLHSIRQPFVNYHNFTHYFSDVRTASIHRPVSSGPPAAATLPRSSAQSHQDSHFNHQCHNGIVTSMSAQVGNSKRICLPSTFWKNIQNKIWFKKMCISDIYGKFSFLKMHSLKHFLSIYIFGLYVT